MLTTTSPRAIATLAPTPNGVDPLGQDTILDFTPGEDKLEFAAALFPGLSAANVAYDSTTGQVSYVANGATVNLVTLQTGLSFNSADVAVV